MKKFIPFLLLSCLLNCEKIADSLFSDKDDFSLGLSMDREIRGNSRTYKILENEKLRKYVQEITNQILRSPMVSKKKVFPYKVTILRDDKIINAFCTPGGFIYVYTGLLKFLDNEASLAAVLAHEIAHAEKRHVRQRMLSSMGIQFIMMFLLGDSGSILREIGVRMAGNLAILANSRGDEMEADEWGFRYMRSTPYYQGAMEYFFAKIQNSKNKTGKGVASVERLLSTHPLPDDRLRKNENRVRSARLKPPTPGTLFTDRYHSMMTELD